MQRQKMKQVKELLRLLLQANEEIKKAIEKKQYDTALEILEQCQDGAIGLGTLIEEAEGEGFVTVVYIEEFCELVYQIHESVLEKGSADAIVTYKAIAKSLSRIEKSTEHDIKVIKTVVFLPYKASMWDALESVFLAADADPDCRAFVIPIPYYDLNQDGSFGTMHYEGHDYPPYVPITDYQTFDFALDRPDMIFIHNPYDEYNRVTSVHPFFYSSKLKDLTDMLVYIPYFVLGDIDPDNENAVEAIKHFCTVPGVANAAYTFVQSERMRRAYIRVLTKQTGEQTKAYWEQKIQGHGSPKLDCVSSEGYAFEDIPDQWKTVLLKKDGTRKKVIFYNTGLRAILVNKEKMLDKIERVLEFFFENKGEIALLWRPHPLYKETLLSMHPELSERYEKITERYQKEAWGIYDDSADLNRAIRLSDAYYGDPSSVVQLYRQTKKPIMIQNVYI